MIKKVNLRLVPEVASSSFSLQNAVERAVGEKVNDWRILRKSIDSRQRNILVDMDIEVACGSDVALPKVNYSGVKYKDVGSAPPVIIVGAGPAGLFAALRCLEIGLKPIVIERGKPVEERLKDIVDLQKNSRLDPESNFCFGEGGAGAFSDGKLFTRSKKRGNIKEVLYGLHLHGADEKILYETHSHIGSDRLPGVIRAIRQTILDHGGEILFGTRFHSLIIEDNEVKGIVTDKGKSLTGPVVLATGHSARDVYETLHAQGIRLEPKGFAMGVRIEHPQPLIDKIFYHNPQGRGRWLPPAEYSLNCQIEGRGVYSFCMCPGGVIVPAMSGEGELVVNGMSASGRSGRWANSGMVVEIRPEDFPDYIAQGPLGLLNLQKDTERRFYDDDGSINAPAQRMTDFIEGKLSSDLPKTSYVAGIHSADIAELLPVHVGSRLKEGLKQMGKRNKGYMSDDAVLIGLESRTSSPVRIPRDKVTLQHPDFKGLYPVGEGAGFAGGIVSSAIDGRNAVDSIYHNHYNKIDEI